MIDILKSTRDDGQERRDPQGHFVELDSWSPGKAEARAQAENVQMTDEHWQIVYALREYYRAKGPVSARVLTKYLEEQFGEGQGRRRLYELFPGGPVRQASLIAGLPLPEGCNNLSFGSVH